MSNDNFSGQVNNSLDLSEIFQSLARSRQQGTLTIRDRYRSKSIYFELGQVTLVSEPRRIRLGNLLVSTGKLNEDDLDLAIKLQKRSNKRLGEILVEEAFCTDVDIQRCVRYQVECELYDVFLWNDVTYSFAAGPMAADIAANGQVTRLKLDSEQLLTEATNRLREWEDSIKPLVPSLRQVYVSTSRSAEGLGLPEKFMAVVPMINGKNSVEDLALAAQLSDFEVCKHLAKMAKIGAVEPLSMSELTSRARESFALQEFDTAAKLFAALEEQNPDDLQFQLPLADSLRQAQRKVEAVEVYDQISRQLEAKQIEFDTLKIVYESIYQIDGTRTDIEDKIRNLDEMRQRKQAARRQWIPYAILAIAAIATIALWVWIGVAFKKQSDENKIRKVEADNLIKLHSEAVSEKRWADAYEYGQKLVIGYADFEGVEKILLPIQVQTRPIGFSVFINNKFVGKTTDKEPKLVAHFDPKRGKVDVEIASDEKKSKVWHEQKLRAFQYHELYVEVQDRAKYSFTAEGEFSRQAGFCEPLNSFVASSRDGNAYVLSTEQTDSLGQLTSKAIKLGRFADLLSSVTVDRTTAFVGTVTPGVVSFDVATAQLGREFPMASPVLSKPLVNETRVVVADSSGHVKFFDRVGEVQAETQRPSYFYNDGVWDKSKTHCFLAGRYGHLLKFEAKTGKLLQNLDLASSPTSHLRVTDERLGVLNENGVALVTSSFDLSLGVQEFRGEGKGPFDFAIADSMVFVSSTDNIMAYDLHSGKVKWRWRGEAPTAGRSRMIIVEDRVVFSQGNEWLRAFSIAEGKLLWHGKLNTGRIESPLCVGKRIVIAGLNGISVTGFSPFYEADSNKEK